MQGQNNSLIYFSKCVNAFNKLRDLLVGADFLLIHKTLGGHSIKILVNVGHVSEIDCVLYCSGQLNLDYKRGDREFVVRDLLFNHEGKFFKRVHCRDSMSRQYLLTDKLDFWEVIQVRHTIRHHLVNLPNILLRGDDRHLILELLKRFQNLE